MRAPNMQALTNDIKKAHPGVVIYGIGDAAHQLRVSDHNEDDTEGVRAAQQDADNIPEHRAIDVMLGDSFGKDDGDELVKNLLADPAARKRLHQIIWYRKIYKDSNGWAADDYDGSDNHTGHVHIAGLAADDANNASWPAVFHVTPPTTPTKPEYLVVDGQLGPKTIKRWQQIMGTPVDGVISENSALVRKVQERLKSLVDHRLVIDGDGNSLDVGVYRKTVAALQRYLKSPVDGYITPGNSQVVKALQRRLNEGRF